jgi:hypothetical protein
MSYSLALSGPTATYELDRSTDTDSETPTRSWSAFTARVARDDAPEDRYLRSCGSARRARNDWTSSDRATGVDYRVPRAIWFGGAHEPSKNAVSVPLQPIPIRDVFGQLRMFVPTWACAPIELQRFHARTGCPHVRPRDGHDVEPADHFSELLSLGVGCSRSLGKHCR